MNAFRKTKMSKHATGSSRATSECTENEGLCSWAAGPCTLGASLNHVLNYTILTLAFVAVCIKIPHKCYLRDENSRNERQESSAQTGKSPGLKVL
jgi:hypothetical protein